MMLVEHRAVNWSASASHASFAPGAGIQRARILLISRTSRNPKKAKVFLRLYGQNWMIRRFTSARLFPHQRVQRVRTLLVQVITAHALSHHDTSIATDFCAETVKSWAIRDY